MQTCFKQGRRVQEVEYFWLDTYIKSRNIWDCRGKCKHNWRIFDHHFNHYGPLLPTIRKKEWEFSGRFVVNFQSFQDKILWATIQFRATISFPFILCCLPIWSRPKTFSNNRMMFVGVLLHASSFLLVLGLADNSCSWVLEMASHSWIHLRCRINLSNNSYNHWKWA